MTHTVLLVDDELHILRAAEFKLRKSGYQVICAHDGEEAWQLIQQQQPDLVVTDLQMPRLNGLELIERIRCFAETRHLPVIMLTAKGLELVPSEAADEMQVYDIMSKPFSPRELCSRVQASLEDAQRNRDFLAAQVEVDG